MKEQMKVLLKMLPNSERENHDKKPDNDAVLGPCPFCGAKGYLGAEATYSHNARAGEMDYAIRCGNCDALGPWGATAYIAATLWNKREEPRSAHRGKAGKFIATATIVLLALLVPMHAGDDWSAFPLVPLNRDGTIRSFWLYNSTTELRQSEARARYAASIKDDNPGVLDDPACRGLVIAQLKAVNGHPADWIITYDHAAYLPDGNGGMNIYHATNRTNGQVWEIIIALHSEQVVKDK